MAHEMGITFREVAVLKVFSRDLSAYLKAKSSNILNRTLSDYL
jgi:hypothetical protein